MLEIPLEVVGSSVTKAGRTSIRLRLPGVPLAPPGARNGDRFKVTNQIGNEAVIANNEQSGKGE
jgi:hypothetical protein